MSNSILGAIVNRFNTSSDAAPLLALVTGGMYADMVPGIGQRPYVTLEEGPTELYGQTKGPYAPHVRNVNVTFWIFGATRATVEAIQDATEVAYISNTCPNPITYTFDSLQYMDSLFADRGGRMDGEGWTGWVSITFQHSKI